MRCGGADAAEEADDVSSAALDEVVAVLEDSSLELVVHSPALLNPVLTLRTQTAGA